MRSVVVASRSGGSPHRPIVSEHQYPRAPSGTEVLLRVAASSINGIDLALVRGDLPSVPGRPPARLGFDVVGEVMACGPGVTAFAVGDRVIGLLGHGGGGQSDAVLVPQKALTIAPTSMPLEHAAALPLAGLTALQALHGVAALHTRPRGRVLVIGAAGGIGSFAVQLARIAGATVTATATGDRAEHLRGLGADEVLDPRRDDPLDSAERWDVVFDTPAALTFAAVRPALTRDGVMVTTRPLSLDVLRSVLTRPVRRSGPRLRVVTTRPDGLDLARLVRLIDGGDMRIPVDRVLPLGDVVHAHRHVSSGAVRGKVVLRL